MDQLKEKTNKEKIICEKCGQIIPTEELIKRMEDKYFKDRLYQNEYKKKKRLEANLLKNKQ